MCNRRENEHRSIGRAAPGQSTNGGCCCRFERSALVFILPLWYFQSGYQHGSAFEDQSGRYSNQISETCAHVLAGAAHHSIYQRPSFSTDRETIVRVSRFLVLWLSILTISGISSAVKEVDENRSTCSGVSIQSYLDIARLSFALVDIVLRITLFTGQSLVVLLTGLGPSRRY